jgi:hypothetical protein
MEPTAGTLSNVSIGLRGCICMQPSPSVALWGLSRRDPSSRRGAAISVKDCASPAFQAGRARLLGQSRSKGVR